MDILSASVSVPPHVCCAYKSQKRVEDPLELDGATDAHEPPGKYWELSLDPLEEQSVVLTAEPSFQP